MSKQNSFTFKLNEAQQAALVAELRNGNYRLTEPPYTIIAAQGPDCTIALYQSGKCLVQGRGAEDWVTFTLEPGILGEVRVGYDEVLHADMFQPHMGIDESGKGDFFGPMVIAAAYINADLAPALKAMNVRDSKTISSDRKAEDMAKDIKKILGERWALVTVGPEAYNRLYASMHNVNRILAWGHARAIENLLEKVPDCPRALSDQFGPARQIENALMKKGRAIRLEQRHKAESDLAVAAASILARAGFIDALRKMHHKYEMPFPKGASDQVQAAAVELIKKKGPEILLQTAKCHFKTTDAVLAKTGHERAVLGELGKIISKPFQGFRHKKETP